MKKLFFASIIILSTISLQAQSGSFTREEVAGAHGYTINKVPTTITLTENTVDLTFAGRTFQFTIQKVSGLFYKNVETNIGTFRFDVENDKIVGAVLICEAGKKTYLN